MTPISNTTEKILAAIETRQVTPRPKWYFVLRHSILWLPGVVTTLLGAYTMAGLLYVILHNPWQHQGIDHYARPIFITAAIPLVWVISFCLFCLVTILLLRRTHTGYKHTAVQLLLVSVASSIIIGILFYALTQDALDNHMDTYYRYPTQHQQDYFGGYIILEK
jgi:glucan phosphoethanolaminetransferase (alkaline phosphatase superfamily)